MVPGGERQKVLQVDALFSTGRKVKVVEPLPRGEARKGTFSQEASAAGQFHKS